MVRSRYRRRRRLKVRCEAPGEQQIKSPRGAARPRSAPQSAPGAARALRGTRDNVSTKGKLEYFQRIT